MKYHLHLIAMLSLAMLTMTSCENSSEELGNEAKKETLLSIRVSRFDVIPFDTRAEQHISDFCKQIHFVVYNSKTKIEVERVDQDTTNDNFGAIDIKLEEGTYILAVVAHSSNNFPSMSSSLVTFSENDMSDVFYYLQDLEVSGETKNLDIALNRATSKFRLITMDNVPTDAEDIRVKAEKVSRILDLTTGLGQDGPSTDLTCSYDFKDDDKGKPFKMEVYLLLNASPKNIRITVSSKVSSKQLAISKTFNDVPMEKNKITQYSGYFWEPAPVDNTRDFTISINSDWQEEMNAKEF